MKVTLLTKPLSKYEAHNSALCEIVWSDIFLTRKCYYKNVR